MANKLKIYACSGIGSTDFNYWLDNTNVLKNTQAVNNLMASIDDYYMQLQMDITNERAVALLNDIDLYTLCLYYAQECSGNADRLEHAGRAIGKMVSIGMFNFDSLDNKERDVHLDELFDNAAKMLQGDIDETNSKFSEWWQTNVIELDKVGMTESQQQLFVNCLQKAIGKTKKTKKVGDANNPLDDKNIGKYLKKAGNYFLYTYFTPAQLAKLPKVFTQKAIWQRQIYEFCKSFYVGVYGTEEAMKKVIRDGIQAEFSATPEKVCKEIASGERTEGVGFDWISLIVSVISAIATIVSAYIVALYQYKKETEIAQQQKLDEAIIKDNMAEDSDMTGLKYKNSGNNTLLWLGAGALGLLLLSRK